MDNDHGITGELRKWAKTLTRWWYDPVKNECTYTSGTMPPSIDAIRLDSNITAIADRIDAELAERYIELPKDADGETWHLGERTESGQTIMAMGLNRYGWYFVGTVNDLDPSIHRHYHEPTVEDVLREFAERWSDMVGGSDKERELFAEYAAKLRLAGDTE